MQIAVALALTLISACALNLGYLYQHGAASGVPPLSLRRPVASLRSLLVEKRWLLGIGVQAAGFVLYSARAALARAGDRRRRDRLPPGDGRTRRRNGGFEFQRP